jgi:hypothetical protein
MTQPTDNRLASRTVDWWPVHDLVEPYLGDPGLIPGTPSWRDRPDTDPAKWQAILWSSVWWALAEDTRQAAMADASREISKAADWSQISRTRSGVYIPREVA